MHSINTGLLASFTFKLYHNLVLPKRFETLIKIWAVAASYFCLPVMAQEQNGWQFDSIRGNSSVSKPDSQQVYEVLLKMLDRWNAHDI
jgi:hypothetical protein